MTSKFTTQQFTDIFKAVLECYAKIQTALEPEKDDDEASSTFTGATEEIDPEKKEEEEPRVVSVKQTHRLFRQYTDHPELYARGQIALEHYLKTKDQTPENSRLAEEMFVRRPVPCSSHANAISNCVFVRHEYPDQCPMVTVANLATGVSGVFNVKIDHRVAPDEISITNTVLESLRGGSKAKVEDHFRLSVNPYRETLGSGKRIRSAKITIIPLGRATTNSSNVISKSRMLDILNSHLGEVKTIVNKGIPLVFQTGGWVGKAIFTEFKLEDWKEGDKSPVLGVYPSSFEIGNVTFTGKGITIADDPKIDT